MLILMLFSVLYSSIMYIYLKHKTNMYIRLLFIDNVIVSILSFIFVYLLLGIGYLSYIILLILIPLLAFLIMQLRFWRTPRRRMNAMDNQIVSPADGNIIYINKINDNDEFVSIKNGKISELSEITQTEIIKKPCWQIGINMTPFDVHKNCSPIDGKIILSKHINGKFHSLKQFLSMVENERHTYVIDNDQYKVGVVQIASKRVRRIDSYVNEQDSVQKGNWIGMIRFGSQVDVFLPIHSTIKCKLKQQVYAIKTIIAEIS